MEFVYEPRLPHVLLALPLPVVMAGFTAKKLPTTHQDLIHDVSYDFYGRRIATCSTDQTVEVWDLDDKNQWKQTARWKTHSGSVWRVTWAHPEFGQALATCSFDRTVAIWEEQVADKKGSHWVQKANLVDSRTSVNDVKFAPQHLGLMLATCSTDGKLRIYEAPDVMNLSQWSLLALLSCKPGTSCLSWNPSRIHPPMIMIGTDDPANVVSGRLQIFEYSDITRKWENIHSIVGVVFDPIHDIAFAPNMGRAHHVLAVASKDAELIHIVPAGTDTHGHTKLEIRHPAQLDHQGAQVWRVEWDMTGTILATAADDGLVRLWKANYQDTWKCISTLRSDSSLGAVPPSSSHLPTHHHHHHSSHPMASSVGASFSKALLGSHSKDKSWMNELGDL